MKVNSKSPSRKNTHVKKTPVPTASSSTIKSTTTTTTLKTTSTTTQPKTSKRVVEAPVVKVENFSPQHEKRIASAASLTSYDLLLFSCSLLLLKCFIWTCSNNQFGPNVKLDLGLKLPVTGLKPAFELKPLLEDEFSMKNLVRWWNNCQIFGSIGWFSEIFILGFRRTLPPP